MMPVASPSEAIVIEIARCAGSRPRSTIRQILEAAPDYLVCTRHHDSVLELLQTAPLNSLGRLPLTRTAQPGPNPPTGLAYSPERGLLAVATRSGSIHLIEIDWRIKARGRQPDGVAAGADGFTRR